MNLNQPHFYLKDVMKPKFLCSLLGLALVAPVFGQDLTYENPGFFSAPPEIPPNIDALNFVNDGQFIINFTNTVWLLPPYQPPSPYEMQNVQNYTNSFGAFLSCNTGLRLENYDPTLGIRQPASTFWNDGTINVGTIDTSNALFFEGAGGFLGVAFSGSLASRFQLMANDITSHGKINMGFESLCTMNASSINLDHGGISMETNGITIDNSAAFVNGLIADSYWGLSTNGGFIGPWGPFIPSAWFSTAPYFTPPHIVTNRNYQIDLTHQLGGPSFLAYLSILPDDGTSNGWTRAVFLSNTNNGLKANVYFPLGATVVEFTNLSGISPNNLYVFDTFAYQTNWELVISGFAGAATRPTFTPFNNFLISLPANFFGGGFGPPTPATLVPPGTFDNNQYTNQNTAYQALIQPNSVVIGDTFGQTYSNSPGRIELYATNYLSMNQARVSSLNFLRLEATNQFGGSAGATISSPYSDFNLRSTNGLLNITNLTVPTLTRDEGTCSLYSARWTNVVGVITNHFHVLFVDAKLNPLSPTRIVNLTLRSTNTLGGPDNVIISDVLNVISNSLTLDCSRLTITANTNNPNAPSPYGGFNLTDPRILWSGSTPRLQYLTNNGFITAPNTVFFQGSRTSPYYSSNYNEAYYTFVNRGGITNYSSRIYATNFVNAGAFSASYGSIELHQAVGALMTNGTWLAPGPAGNITIETGSLFASNHTMLAGAALTLTVTNRLDDGSLGPNSADAITNKNFWTTANGINLPILPPQASLLGTSISNRAADYAFVHSVWAGATNRGNSAAGFANNAALGRLILDGRIGVNYDFAPAAGNNALYIDRLELLNFVATNVDLSGNWVSIVCDPGMTVYYGQALANGRDISEKLNTVNNGQFQWVSNYNTGFWSSTNIVYTDGTTNRLNTALVHSCDIDSNGNGIPNCMDPNPIPVLSGAGLQLAVGMTNRPSASALVSWLAFPGTSNTLYSASSSNPTNWTVVTNIVYSGPVPTRISVVDPVRTNGFRFYRVRAITR